MELAAVRELAAGLRAGVTAVDDAERVELLRALEELKSTAAAVQASVTAQFVASQRREQRAVGVPADRVGRGIAAQVGLARRMSPYAAQRYVGWAMIVTSELPDTFAELLAGRTSEWRATLVARETAWLSREHRAIVDHELAPQLEYLGDRRVEHAARKRACELDPEGALARTRLAHSERCVTLRPAPDGMARLGVLAPLEHAVAAYAALGREADSLVAAGDGRSRGQVMADTAIGRVTGQQQAADIPVEIQLEMPLEVLLGISDAPARLQGGGPIPGEHARQLVFGPAPGVPRWIRRLWRSPKTGQLVAMESRRRRFTTAQRRFIAHRDEGICATPWCDAPIRHIDHITAKEHGGKTRLDNGQGLCAACNYAKQAPGWTSNRTPTGHHYARGRPRPPDITWVELRAAELFRQQRAA